LYFLAACGADARKVTSSAIEGEEMGGKPVTPRVAEYVIKHPGVIVAETMARELKLTVGQVQGAMRLLVNSADFPGDLRVMKRGNVWGFIPAPTDVKGSPEGGEPEFKTWGELLFKEGAERPDSAVEMTGEASRVDVSSVLLHPLPRIGERLEVVGRANDGSWVLRQDNATLYRMTEL
jgi:hypothetical protein